MKFKINNIGKIKESTIEINGITIIAGENNTGKSTIGKTLFCVFDAFHDIAKQIREERKEMIQSIIWREYDRNRMVHQMTLGELVYDKNVESLIDELIKSEGENVDDILSRNEDYKVTDEVINTIKEVLEIPDRQIVNLILKRSIFREFANDFLNVNNKKTAEVNLTIKDRNIISFKYSEDIDVDNYIDLEKNVIYIDDPFVLDSLGDVYRTHRVNISDYQLKHRRKLVRDLLVDEDRPIIESIISNQKLENVLASLNNISRGSMLYSQESRNYVYRDASIGQDINVSNLSTGLKSFVILKTLLQNGRLEENGLVILDEPEIHLHPMWQIQYAEIIVKLHMEFGINLLINTHSPYFLEAIEEWVNYYQINNSCKYYLTDVDKNGVVSLSDVSTDLEKIYVKLFEPFQELENLKNEKI